MRYLKRLLIAGVFLCIILFTPPTVLASGEFQADYDVQYAIAPSGKTIVTQQVTLTNQLPNFYPQEYSLILDSDKIRNVIAYDDGGIVTPVISAKDGKTEITLAFNVKTIGLGKSFTFSLRYEHGGIASRNGSIWEIYVPGVINDADIGKYDVTLSVPPTFGPAAYLSPQPTRSRTWIKEQMIRGGITAAYGESQNFSVTLRYTLINEGTLPHIQEIALPPGTAYQKVTLNSLSPAPLTVVSDADGNWLARYQVQPKQSVSVTAKLTASVFLVPRKDYQVPPVDEQAYLTEQKYWQTKNSAVIDLATRYTTPRRIYDYVSRTLSYDYKKINAQATRMGAVDALSHPKKAICMEYTDLFVAIARAAGIPARRMVGYAYTNNPKLRPLSLVSDVLHAWPEYYDRNLHQWIPVDPTWAHTTGGIDYFTKLDFNHIVFAINGLNSQEPYPAGYYRSEETPGRDVTVEFAEVVKEYGANVTTTIEFPDQVGAGTRVEGAIVVTNKGGESAYNIAIHAISEPQAISVTETITELLPYAVARIPIRGVFEQTITSKPGQIRARVNDVTLTHSFRIQPFYWLIVIGVLTSALSIVVALKLIHIFLWKIFRKR